MPILENFKPFNFNEGVPYVSVTSNGMTFNKSVVMKLGFPENVVLLIDESSQQIAIQVCSEGTQNAVQFYRPKSNNILSVRWNARDLLNTICEITGWDLTQGGYRVDGQLLKEENAMLFDLTKATKLQ